MAGGWPKAGIIYQVDTDFIDAALDLKLLYGNTKPSRRVLAQLVKSYRDNPETLEEEVLSVFKEAQNNPKPINWR